ncbi:hypothetical protein BIW11_12919 [Tropilaelaps mercedesae]|uniref:Uncharacterized protein n=1 Tax=Tropilaelaps mercedesae TaxID=418985 RepID=A0A1V9X4Y0_9ACAR|nr:hypothetical protein BIW11_12919 [Tropilaelaps mercedesae]
MAVSPIYRIRITLLNVAQLYKMSFALALLTATLQANFAQGQWVDETLTGSVEGGRFAQYSLSKPGRVIITLTPKQGDPDIYVGENGTEPDYHLDRHSYQSTTCGIERVVVPTFALRPIGIGVYGHPSHEYSVFELHVRVEDEMDEYDDLLRAESSFESMEDDAYAFESNSDGRHSTAGYGADRATSRGRSPATNSGADKGGVTSSSGPDHSADDGPEWEDWDEFPVYNILLTLLRLFWEMLLTL